MTTPNSQADQVVLSELVLSNIPPTRKELYEMLRKQIEHEDNLVNHRLNWLLFSQGFLFLAFVTLLTVDKPLSHKTIALCLIAFFGFFVSLFTFLSIFAAFKSLKRLRQTWAHPNQSDEKLRRLAIGFPQITWVGKWYANATNAAGGIPMLIMVMWALLIAFVLYDVWVIGSIAALFFAFLVVVGVIIATSKI